MTRELKAPYDFNVATLSDDVRHNAKNMGGDKETIDTMRLVLFVGPENEHDDGFRTAVEARFYMGRSGTASTVYCSVWIYEPEHRDVRGGHGRAGGYGYCKKSAALEEAFRSAGVTFAKGFGGAGDSASREAMKAVAMATGWNLSEIPFTIM